jgi:hypothetical protein
VRHLRSLASFLAFLVDDVDRVRLEDAARTWLVVAGLGAAAARAREAGLAPPAVSRYGYGVGTRQ